MFRSIRGQLGDIQTTGMSRRELVDLIEGLRRLKGATASLEARATTAINSLADKGLDGAGVLRTAGRMSSRAATKSSATADQLTEMPQAAAALESGQITPSHADSIAAAAELVSATEADQALSARATGCPADLFAKECRQWVARHRRDSAEELHARRRAARSVSDWIDSDGMFNLKARLDPEAGAVFKARLDHRTDQLFNDDGGRDGGAASQRTSTQRRADALVSLVGARSPDGADGESSPATGPASARHPKHQITVVSDIGRLRSEQPEGAAEIIGVSEPVPQSMLERMACDASITGVLFDGPGRPIYVGRTIRTAAPAQWTALIARDKACVGCGAHVNRCEAHHIKAWQANGTTDITNLVLVCSRCHHDIHDRGMELHQVDGKWQLRLRSPAGDSGPGDTRRRPHRTQEPAPASLDQSIFGELRRSTSRSSPATLEPFTKTAVPAAGSPIAARAPAMSAT